jgi:phthalate 4,5-dioxygenase reductase subunit
MTLHSPSQTTATDSVMLSLQVSRKYNTAPNIAVFELVRADGAALPPFEAGAHVVVLTPAGLTRRYSLCNAPGETHRYVLAIQRDAQGLGGSVSMVDQVQVGDTLAVSRPENYFPLDTGTHGCLLIAGGIGITPILSMAHALRSQGRPFTLIYCTREAASTAFREELSQPAWQPHVKLHHSGGMTGQRLDLSPWLMTPQAQTQLYCCGPRALMQSVRESTAHWPKGHVHFEDFGTSPTAPSTAHQDHAFTVVLSRQNKHVTVPAGESILSALRAQGLAVPSSCESGTCGACRTGLLGGRADHRDYVLDEDDHDTQIMICVSRACTPELVLDL